MGEKREIMGLWWLPTKPDEQWVGTLTLDHDSSPKLRITVSKNAFQIGESSPPPTVIHGQDQNGSPITLLALSWPRAKGGMLLSQVEYSAHYAVLNLQVSDRSEFEVNKLILRMQHLQEWFGISGFQSAVSDSAEEGISIRHKNPKDEAFQISEDLSVSFHPSYTIHNGVHERKLGESLSVSFVSKKGLDLSECKHLQGDFRLLLHFATLRKNYPLEIRARKNGHGFTHDGHFYSDDIEIWNSIIKDDVTVDWHSDEWIFKFADVRNRFAEFLSDWIKLTESYEEALNCYSTTVYNSLPSPVEHLCLTQALEAYYGIKFAAREGVHFREKIQTLAERYGEHLKGLVDDAAEFAEVVRDNRNYYTHHDPEIMRRGRVISGSRLIRLNEKLKLLFQMCVLTEMGIPAERFQKLRRQLASGIMDLE